MLKKTALSLFTLLVFSSCSDEVISEGQLYEMATKVTDKVEIVLPKDLKSGIKCSDYGEGCIRGRFVKVHGVIFPVIQFENEKQACKNAFNIDQYCAKNWLFDDVTNEPVLEYFVKDAFKAVRPAKEVIGNQE